MVLATTMIGTQDMVRGRMRAWRDAGVTTLRIYPDGSTITERLETLAHAMELVHGLDGERL
jgi:hypothetical protein